MGQRLCLEIKKKGKVIANAYYHWSGYTGSSARIISECYDFLSKYHSNPDSLFTAIKALENTGASLLSDGGLLSDYHRIISLPKYKDIGFSHHADRNSGLIACFPKSTKYLLDASEEYCSIDMDTLLIDFSVMCFYSDLDEVKEYFEDIDEGDIPELDMDPTELDYGSFKDLVDNLDNNDVVKCGESYFSAIE